MRLATRTQQEADDLIEAAQALEAAAKKIKQQATQLRKGELLPTWGYVYGRSYLQAAWTAADELLNGHEPPAPAVDRKERAR